MVPHGADRLRAAFGHAAAAAGLGSRAGGRVVVAFADPQAWLPWASCAAQLLSPDEAVRVRRFRSAALREARTIAYSLHRLLLGLLLGRDPTDVPLVRDGHGCPRVARHCVHTSLSHAEGCIAMAVSFAGPVGVDVEPAARAAVMPEIAGRVCHRSEALALASLAGPEREAALLALWVRKESLLKAAGVGLSLEMDRFCAAHGLSGSDRTPVRAWMLDAGNGWTAALAAPPEAVVSTAWLRPDAGRGR